MPAFNLRWANRSTSNQDWIISNGDHFSLQPNFVRSVNLQITHDFQWVVVVEVDQLSVTATLSYSSATQSFNMFTPTPNEFQLAQGNGVVTLRCSLSAANTSMSYLPAMPIYDVTD